MIIYSDEEILVVNKNCGEAVQPGPGVKNVLTEMYSAQYGNLYVVHRIDTPVSGVVVLARTKSAATSLSSQFADEGAVKKIYLAAVDAPPPGQSGRLEDNIHIPSGRKANKVYIRDDADKSTKKAVLDYRLVLNTDSYYILEIELITGRRHQIRAQLTHAGCRIKGDVKYGAKRTNRGGGIHLHSRSLSFRHPKDGRRLTFTAPLPEDPLWNYAADSLKLKTDSDQQDN